MTYDYTERVAADDHAHIARAWKCSVAQRRDVCGAREGRPLHNGGPEQHDTSRLPAYSMHKYRSHSQGYLCSAV